jgi:hypothetical protein
MRQAGCLSVGYGESPLAFAVHSHDLFHRKYWGTKLERSRFSVLELSALPTFEIVAFAALEISEFSSLEISGSPSFAISGHPRSKLQTSSPSRSLPAPCSNSRAAPR